MRRQRAVRVEGVEARRDAAVRAHFRIRDAFHLYRRYGLVGVRSRQDAGKREQ
jgi:hypothetical protein